MGVGWMDGWVAGWVGGWMMDGGGGGWMGGLMDGWIDQSINQLIPVARTVTSQRPMYKSFPHQKLTKEKYLVVHLKRKNLAVKTKTAYYLVTCPPLSIQSYQ